MMGGRDAYVAPPMNDASMPPRDAFTPPVRDVGTDAFAPPRDAGRRMCVPSCTTNAQCGSSCPLVTGSASCCDLMSNTCYTSTTSVCPVPGEDAGMTMY